MNARDDQWQQHADVLQMEHEAIESLKVIAAAGFTKEADTLASACGLWSQWKPEGRSMVSEHSFKFPY